jgi:hypothetical protein
MLMSHSGRTRLVTATVSGTVETSGEGAETVTSDVQATPDEVDFGSLTASQTLVEPIILRNITSIPIKISEIYVDASESAGFDLKADCKKLEPGQACIATVSWSPKLRGPSSGVMVVKHDGPSALTSVNLKGEYTPDTVNQAEVFPEAIPGRGLLVSSQTEVDFGTDVATASTITVSLVNVGDSPLKIADIAVAGADNGLSFKTGGCSAGLVLEPIEACPLTVTWSPTRSGTLLDDIQVVHDGARGILVLPIRGASINPVSQDQGLVMMANTTEIIGGSDPLNPSPDVNIDSPQNDNSSADPVAENLGARQEQAAAMPQISNPMTVLDGLKITSFSPTRAIIAGPGGSRILFDDEEIVLGGVPWLANIQRNGIEFSHKGQTVLLLFDRSLSSVNLPQGQSLGSGGGGSSSASSATSNVSETTSDTETTETETSN